MTTKLTPCPIAGHDNPHHYHTGPRKTAMRCDDGRFCDYEDGHFSRCYSAHVEPEAEPAPLVALPTVDEIAEVLRCRKTDTTDSLAADVLDLLEARIPRWVRVEPGEIVKEGTRYRAEFGSDAYEHRAYLDFRATANDGGRWFIDPRTAPAEPDAELVEYVMDEIQGCYLGDNKREPARRIIARINAAREVTR